jgi:hypothetical protein
VSTTYAYLAAVPVVYMIIGLVIALNAGESGFIILWGPMIMRGIFRSSKEIWRKY